METQKFGLKRLGNLLYVDGKDDVYFAEIFDSGTGLTPELEERFYRLYWGKLMGVAHRYMPDRESAREVVNDSFVKAFKKLPAFRGEGPDKSVILLAWLTRITVNTAIDRLRVLRTWPEMVSIDKVENQPTVEMDDRLQLEDMLRLIQGLPDLHRVVFNLYELEGYSHEEIGQMMKIPTSSSRVYLAKAKQELRALYINYFGGRYDG